MHPLEAIDWRIERADKHLAALDRERRAVLDQEDNRIVGHFERDSSEYVFRFGGKLPDSRIGLIVGEFGHHLRAALDNLLWQLVLLRGSSPTSKTQFPIYEGGERYQSSLWMLRGVSADDRAAIEAVQPFKHGDQAGQSYLALLAWLNNVDKHRFLHVGCAIPRHLGIPVVFEGQKAGLFPWQVYPVKDIAEILDVKYVPTITSDDRAELMRVRIKRSGSDPQMKMEGDPPIDVALSDPKHALIFADLKLIRDNVLGIIEGFRPRFDVVAGVA